MIRRNERTTAWNSAALHSWQLGDAALPNSPALTPIQACAAELEAAVEQTLAAGGMPFFVGATAGSTVLGAFDPLSELARVSAGPSPLG